MNFYSSSLDIIHIIVVETFQQNLAEYFPLFFSN